MEGFPGLSKPALYERELPATVLLTLPPAVAAAIFASKLDGALLYVASFSLVWLVIGSVLKVQQAWKKDRKSREMQGPERLRVCLYAMHAAALTFAGRSPKDEGHRQELRLTIHRLEGEEFVQLFDYIGGQRPSAQTIGRRRVSRLERSRLLLGASSRARIGALHRTGRIRMAVPLAVS